MPFQSLELSSQIIKAITEQGYTSPTPIQSQSIPLILQGKDLMGCAQTGTGKTAAFSMPVLHMLAKNKSTEKKRPIRGLILTPTRELAMQIGESLFAYGKYTGLTFTTIFGGVTPVRQIRALQKGVDILVATPGRLLDLFSQGHISLKNIELFVLDEADRMLDLGFINDIQKILLAVPKKRQSLFFSATMEPQIIKLANTILVNPMQVKVTPISSTAETIKQFLYYVDKPNKNNLLIDVLANPEIKSCLIFTRTKHAADKVVTMLNTNKIRAEAIHSNKSQGARQAALNNFKARTTRVLVATDIASRGIDVDNLEHVINYDIPNVAETYVHRIGRTGRAGNKGTAISFCDAEEKPYFKSIEKLIAKNITIVKEHPFPLLINNPPKTIGVNTRGNSGGNNNSRPQRGNSNTQDKGGPPNHSPHEKIGRESFKKIGADGRPSKLGQVISSASQKPHNPNNAKAVNSGHPSSNKRNDGGYSRDGRDSSGGKRDSSPRNGDRNSSGPSKNRGGSSGGGNRSR
jgi:ATP-dependent RNA helicase RhlE